MARRSREEAEQTKRCILETSLRLFYEKGVPGVTLSEIAREAGYTRGAIYCHFSSKTEILIELLLETSSNLSEEIYKVVSDERTPLENLFIISMEFLNKVEECRNFGLLVRVLFYSLHLLEEPELKKTVLDIFNDHKQNDRHFLEKARIRGELRPDLDIDKVSDSISSVIRGLLMDWILDRSSYSSERSSHALRIFFRGISMNGADIPETWQNN